MDIFFEAGDMSLSGPDISFTNENNEIVQRLIIRLNFLFGEWFLNIKVGMPYTNLILEKGTNISDTYAIFYDEIKSTEGVTSIEKLEITPAAGDRSILVSFEVNDKQISSEILVII